MKTTNTTTVGEAIAKTNGALLKDAVRLLATLPPDVYAKPVIEGSSSIGAHIRHVLDHYDCFLQGLPVGHVDYTSRARSPEVEASIEVASRKAESIIEALRALAADDHPIRVPGLGDAPGTVESTVHRELQFLASHTIHHYAIVGLLCRAAGQPVPEHFGLAPSTVKVRQAGG